MKPSPVRAMPARASLQRSSVLRGTSRSSPGSTSGDATAGPPPGPEWGVSVNEDCRHYVMRTTPRGERLERCKVDANEPLPFACPEGCVFYEPRKVSRRGVDHPGRRLILALDG